MRDEDAGLTGLCANSAMDLIGSTPLVRLSKLSPEKGATVWAKAELLNCSGSVKDRPARAMIVAAEAQGALKPGAVIVEATSGNTGISLAMIAAVRGYRCILVMPEDMSLARRYVLQAYGAEVELTAGDEGMAGAVERARHLVKKHGGFMPSQFSNEATPKSHEDGTAVEIWQQTQGEVSAFIAGVGTGGTLTGVARTLKLRSSGSVQIVAVEPAQSPVLSGGEAGAHGIQGLGAGFVPEIYDASVVDRVMTVGDVDAERMARRLAREEGLLVGPSSGANVHAAVVLAAEMSDGIVVTVLCDSGERYLF